MPSCRNFCFTIFNYGDHSLNALKAHKSIRYIIAGEEICPTTQHKHLQGYCEFKSSVEFSVIQKLLPKVHIEPRRGTSTEAADYCKKDNKIFLEQGEMSKPQGKRTDIDNAVETIMSGATYKEVARQHPVQFVKYYRGFKELMVQLIEDRTKPPEVYVYWGGTGTGKSKTAREECPNAWVWAPQMEKWFQNYMGQKEAIFEEFRGQITFGHLLSICDPYNSPNQNKGGDIPFVAQKIIFTSPIHPEEWYQNLRGDDSIDQFIRRITKIVHFKKPPQKKISEFKL